MTSTRVPLALRAAAGIASAGLALGVAQLVSAFTGPEGSPVVAVGSVAVDASPVWLKDFAIRTFGEDDKIVLVAGILAVIAVYAAIVGIFAFRRRIVAVVGVGLFGALGVAAALTRPTSDLADALPSLAGGSAGVAALLYLVHLSSTDVHDTGREVRVLQESDAASSLDSVTAMEATGWGRRRFLAVTGVVVAGAAATYAAGRFIAERAVDVAASRAGIRLPRPASPAPPLPAAVEVGLPGVTPFVTPNADFYRVDTALVLPRLTAEDWSLRVHGMVDRELTLSYDDLLSLPLVERHITLTCVSNEVGGQYVGNAKWLGVPLRDVLEEAGIDPAADQLVSRSSDGWTCGTPTKVVMDGRDALLAVGMNGEPLPQRNGFPVRMVVPGLYGYVSATKWLVDLELSTFETFDPYWVQRGWAAKAPIKTMTRIESPKPLATVGGGMVRVGGVAWAQRRGIDAVEVRVDGGDWLPARLADEASLDTWRQWVFDWDARPGRHTLEARATDGINEVQTGDRMPPFPSGSSGWHSVVVTVS